MVSLENIDSFLLSEFNCGNIADIAINGIQIEGTSKINKISVAVDAAHSTLLEAASRKSQLLLVHHGIFWGKPFAVRGCERQVIQGFLDREITLYALHLPLDAHLQLGNSVQLAQHLHLKVLGPAAEFMGTHCGILAENPQNLSLNQIKAGLSTLDGAETNFCSMDFGPSTPKRICIVTGAGCEQIERYRDDGFDTIITGEPRQFAYHYAKAHKLNALFPGHYASETLGVCATAELLAQKFGIEWDYISEPTGV